MKRVIAGILTLCLTAGLMLCSVSAQDYQDIQGHWGQEAIQQMTELGFFSGTSENTFSPDVALTRGMFVTVLAQVARWMELPVEESADAAFADVSLDAYYAVPVAWAYHNGLVAGVGDNKFQPDSPITREQMCVILVQFLSNYAGYDLSQYSEAPSVFLDQDSINLYARQSVTICYSAGLISGVPAQNGVEFQPAALASRAAVAVVLRQVTEQVENWKNEESDVPPATEESGNGAGAGSTGSGESGSTGSEEISQEMREQEAAVAGYLETMVENYHNSSYLLTTDQEVQDCMKILMDCIEDALNQRTAGQFLSKEFIRGEYADQISELKAAYDELTESQLSQANNVIIRLEKSENLYTVMDYFGVSGVDI